MDQTTETRIANLDEMKKVRRSHRQRLRLIRLKEFTRSLLSFCPQIKDKIQSRLMLCIRLKTTLEQKSGSSAPYAALD